MADCLLFAAAEMLLLAPVGVISGTSGLPNRNEWQALMSHVYVKRLSSSFHLR